MCLDLQSLGLHLQWLVARGCGCVDLEGTTGIQALGGSFAAILARMTAHIAHIIPSFSVAMSDSKSTVSKTDSMCPLGMVEFPAGNQNSDVLLAWGKLCRINSLKPPFEHVARTACFPTQSQALSLISNKTTVPADGLPSPKINMLIPLGQQCLQSLSLDSKATKSEAHIGPELTQSDL